MKDMVLIMSDQHGWDYTGFADERIDTPGLKKIAIFLLLAKMRITKSTKAAFHLRSVRKKQESLLILFIKSSCRNVRQNVYVTPRPPIAVWWNSWTGM